MPRVLVDSSVWVRAEKGHVVIAEHAPLEEIATCPLVVSELLRGTRDEHHYEKTRAFLMLVQMLDAPTPLERFEEAARLYLTCRAKAITVASIDCLIAATAIAHDAALMHNDSDFDRIATVVPLEIYPWKRVP